MRLTAIVAILVACLAVTAFAVPRQAEAFDESNDVECQLCEWVINELKSVVVQNDTEAIILSSLEQACKYLPNQDLANECDELVQNYGPQLLQFLDQEVDPDMVCKYIGLCSSSASVDEVTSSVQGTLECTICQWVAGELEKMITTNSTESEIIAAVEKVCFVFHNEGLENLCKDYISAYGPELITMLVNKESPQAACQQLHVCSSTVSHEILIEFVSELTGNALECTVCEWALEMIDNQLSSNATDAEIISVVDKVCSMLPSTLGQLCESVVNVYGDSIIQALVAKINPDKVCTAIGVCSSETSFAEDLTVSANPVECAACHWVTSVLENYLAENSTEAEIVSVVEHVCDIVKGSLRTVCDSYIETYGDQIISLLVNKIEAANLCAYLHMCSSGASDEIVAMSTMSAATTNGLECTICQWVIGEVEKYLSSNASEQEVISVLESVCSFVPSAERQICQAYLNEYAPLLVQYALDLLVQKEDPATVCKAVGVCVAAERCGTLAPSVPAVTAPESLECTLCNLVMDELAKYINSSSTESEIIAVVDQICNVLPSALRPACTSVINEYGPEIVQLLVNKVPFDQICTKIGLCSSVTVTVTSNAAECALCTFVAGEIKTILGSATTDAEIEKGLDALCGKLPASVSGMCQMLVNEYAPYFIDLLLNNMDPNAVCAKLGLCASAAVEVEQQQPVGGIECALCELALDEVEKILQGNTSVAAVEAALDKVCNALPRSVASACDDLVQEYYPELVNYFSQGFPPSKICGLIHLCSSSEEAVEETVTDDNGVECALCEYALAEVESLLGNNRTQAAVEAALDKVCNALPRSIASACDDLVATYYPQLVYLLQQDLPASKICGMIGLCSSRVEALAAPAPNGFECAACEWVVAELEKFVENPRTEDEIISFVNGTVCGLVPGLIRSYCDELVDSYGPLIIQTLINRESPATLCTQIKFCTSASVVVVAPAAAAAQTGAAPNDLKCAACEWIMSEVENYITANSTQAEIIQFLDKVCSIVPSVLRTECTNLLDQYGPEIIQLLVNRESPATICQQIGICSRTTVTVAQPTPAPNDFKCAACEWIMAEVENYITANTTEAEIIQFLDKVCSIVPSSLRSECTNLLDQYGPELIQMLAQREPPATICQQIGICSRSKVVAKQAENVEVCGLCKWLFTKLDAILQEPIVDEDIIKEADKLCGMLPGEMGQVCDTIVDSFGPDIIQLIINGASPDVLCHTLRMCPTA